MNTYLKTAIHIASSGGNIELVEWILNKNNNYTYLTETDGNGLTPLHCASYRGHLSLCLKLLEKGKDEEIYNIKRIKSFIDNKRWINNITLLSKERLGNSFQFGEDGKAVNRSKHFLSEFLFQMSSKLFQ